MAAFAILRVEKLKSAGEVHRALKHVFREQDTPNADQALRVENRHIGATTAAEGMAAFQAKMPEKIRKNGVLALEYVITASPEALQAKTREQQDGYMNDALDWIRARHGDTVVYAGIHRDEKTVHLHAYVVPLDPDTGRLNARRWLGGAKALQEMQTDFANTVGKPHGLERGIEGSKARHTTVKEFYAAINQAEAHAHVNVTPEDVTPKVVKKRLFSSDIENEASVASRINAAVQKHYAPTIKEASVARLERRRAEEMVRTARTLQDEKKTLQERLNGFLKLFGGLTSGQVQDLARQAATMRKANELTAEQQRRVDALPDLVRKRAGAVHTFALRALDAIKKASGNWRLVEWAKVEKEAWLEAVKEHRQPVKAALEGILLVSPGQANLTPEQAKKVAAAAPEIPGLDNSPAPSQSRGFSR